MTSYLEFGTRQPGRRSPARPRTPGPARSSGLAPQGMTPARLLTMGSPGGSAAASALSAEAGQNSRTPYQPVPKASAFSNASTSGRTTNSYRPVHGRRRLEFQRDASRVRWCEPSTVTVALVLESPRRTPSSPPRSVARLHGGAAGAVLRGPYGPSVEDGSIEPRNRRRSQ